MSFKSLAETIKNDFSNFYKALSSNVVDSLASTSTNLPLSANQGKVLNEKINENTKNLEKLIPVGYIFTWTNCYVPEGKDSTEIITGVDLTNPTKVHDYFGFGTWVRIKNSFLYSGSDELIGTTGGEATVKLTVSNLPSHDHDAGTLTTKSAGAHTHDVQLQRKNDATYTSGEGIARPAAKAEYGAICGRANSAGAHTHSMDGRTASTGSNTAHNNMPPYFVVYMWMRVNDPIS